jgi:hypothetical protein
MGVSEATSTEKPGNVKATDAMRRWRSSDQSRIPASSAPRLGKSRAYVTTMLRYGPNLTVHTIADVFTALGRTPRLVDRPLSVSSPPLVVIERMPTSPNKARAHLGDVEEKKGARNQA